MAQAPKLAWVGCSALAMKDGIRRLADLPDSIYRRQVGESWRVVFNGSESKVTPEDAAELDPFHIYVEFNGFPAGVFGPFDGVIAAGTAANEDAFIAAIEAELGAPIMQAFRAMRTH